MYGFVLCKFVKPYVQSVLFKTGSLHNTIVSRNTSISFRNYAMLYRYGTFIGIIKLL